MDVRRRAVLALVTAALAGGAGFAVFAAAPDVTADRRAAPAPTSTPAAVSPEETEALDEAAAHAANLAVLLAALGPDFERANPQAQAPFRDSLVPVAGRTPAGALPDGYAARAHVSVSTDAPCDPDALAATTEDGAEADCESRKLSDGREVVLLAANAATLEASAPVALRHVYFTQPDGDVVDVSLAVLPDFVEDLSARIPRAEITAWLDPFENALIEAATDPQMAPGSAAAREQAERARTEQPNEEYLQQALGPDFAVAGEEVIAAPGSIEALPAELTARAVVVVGPPDEENFACVPVDGRTCRSVDPTRGLPVLIETAEAVHSAAGSNFGQTEVRYRRGDGRQEVIVQLSVLGRPGGGVTPELEQAVRDWLESMEQALIAAATDPRMSA